MRLVLIFNLQKNIEQSIKLLLICPKMQGLLNLEDYKAYINNANEINIPVLNKKNLINVTFSQLTSSICIATSFLQALIDLSELQFVSSPDLSNKSYNCIYTHKIIVFNKMFNISWEVYCLDIFFSLVFTTKRIDKSI